MDIKKKNEDLRKEVIKHDLLYAKGTPIITDTEYDRLYNELITLEEQNPQFFDENSPTQKIYDVVVEGLKKVKHSTPMLSQDKVHTEEEIRKFASKADDDIIDQDKIDGLTIVLHYDNHVFQQGVTRGSGDEGEDVTHSIRTVKDLPKYIPFGGKLEVRAEAVIPEAEFERINTTGEYKSARNLVSGTVRNLNASVAKERGVSIITFDVVKAEGMDFKTDEEMLLFQKEQGFNVVPYKIFRKDEIDELIEYCLTFNEKRRHLIPYKIDGRVLKFNSLKVREELGYTAKHPRWACAFKFDSLDATTKLKGVYWTVGKSGQLTPNADLESVEIDGVTIQRASLANYDNILKRDIRIGDTVVTARANDVIPQVVSSVKELRTGEEIEVHPPTECPVCGEAVMKESANFFCVNDTCPAQVGRLLQHFVSRQAMSIDGLGEKTVSRLYHEGLIADISDIYRLEEKRDILSTWDRFGEKSIIKMLNGIEASKQAPLHKVLFGLGIRNVGESTGKDIAKAFGSMKNILEEAKDKKALLNKLLNIPDVGEIVANSIAEFFTHEDNVVLIEKLMDYGLSLEAEKVEELSSESKIAGKTFVITGALSRPRNDIKSDLERAGAKVTGSVSKKTDYLVFGGDDTGSSKYQKAVSLEVPIITEEELAEML